MAATYVNTYSLMALRKAQRLVSPRSQMEAGKQSEQGLYLFLVPFTYSPANTIGFSGTNFGPAVGSNLVNSTVPGAGTVGNLYGLQAFYQVSPKLAINGWVSYAAHRYLGYGDGNAMDWAVGLAFPDLFSRGALGGFLVGMEPKITRLSPNVNLGAGAGQADKDTSLHVEAFYQYKIGDNIEMTPGLIWITAPDSDSSNPDSLFAWFRTVFRF